jgi:hypothetical protein
MMTRIVAVTLSIFVAFTFAAATRAQTATTQKPGALRIVVLKGEDAVNIIQQKTAVAPVIEVRDRNNLPVAGATVTFAVGQGATFGGASTLTVVTNAAGQAVATSLTPTAAGAIQIQATALFQGQTALATIAQSNFLTAAHAAAATGSAGGASTGAAGGGGGGISATTIGIAGGVVGAAAIGLAAAGGADSSSNSSAVTPPPATNTPSSNSPPATATTSTYSGPIAMQQTYVDTWTCSTGVFSCSRVYSLNGSLSITLTRASDNSVMGIAELTDTGRLVSESGGCTVVQTGEPQPFTSRLQVTGTVPDFGFEQTTPVTEAFGSGTLRVAFRASLSAGSVSGTLTRESTFVNPSNGGCSFRSEARSSVPVTLR